MDNSRRLYIEWQNQSYSLHNKKLTADLCKISIHEETAMSCKNFRPENKMKLHTGKNISFLFFTYFPCPYVAFGPCFLW